MPDLIGKNQLGKQCGQFDQKQKQWELEPKQPMKTSLVLPKWKVTNRRKSWTEC